MADRQIDESAVAFSLEFAKRVAKTMLDLSSSHVFFVLQQAYQEMDWAEAKGILERVVREVEANVLECRGCNYSDRGHYPDGKKCVPCNYHHGYD